MIGDTIKRYRQARSWSQEHLADLMGYKSKSTINKIEKNINDVNQSTLVKFAKVFGCDPTDLLVDNAPDEEHSRMLKEIYRQLPADIIDDSAAVSTAITIVNEYEELSPEKKDQFLAYLKFLKSDV